VLRLAAVLALAALLAVPAASARSAKLTPAENAWAAPVVNMMKSLSGRVGAIRGQVSDPAVLTKASKAQLKLALTLANIIVCVPKLKKLGPPPTARLQPFYAAVRSACSYYTAGAHSLAKGIGKLSASQITASMTQIKHGSALLALAQSRLVPLAS
jgi:hypothetical protein